VLIYVPQSVCHFSAKPGWWRTILPVRLSLLRLDGRKQVFPRINFFQKFTDDPQAVGGYLDEEVGHRVNTPCLDRVISPTSIRSMLYERASTGDGAIGTEVKMSQPRNYGRAS
jgi:hypothetical protein